MDIEDTDTVCFWIFLLVHHGYTTHEKNLFGETVCCV